MKIDATNASEQSRLYGRHFDHNDQLVSRISRESINALKAHFADEMGKDDWRLVRLRLVVVDVGLSVGLGLLGVRGWCTAHACTLYRVVTMSCPAHFCSSSGGQAQEGVQRAVMHARKRVCTLACGVCCHWPSAAAGDHVSGVQLAQGHVV